MTANWFMEDEMDTRLEEIMKALERIANATHAPCDCFSGAADALALLIEIQNEHAVDVENLMRKEKRNYGYDDYGHGYDMGWNQCIDDLATRGLLRGVKE